jgi:hypothetical protein
MDKSDFFVKLITSLINQGYRVDEQVFNANYNQVEKYNKTTAVKLNLALGAAEVLSAMLGNHISFNDTSLELQNIDEKEFMGKIRKLQSTIPYILYRFVYSQPIIIGLIDGDDLESREYANIMKEYDSMILNFRKYAGKSNGQRLGIYGLLFFVFSNVDKSTEFAQKHVMEIKISHFWKKAYTLPCGIDIFHKNIIKYKGIPVLLSNIIDYKRLEKDLFECSQEKALCENTDK